MKYYVWKEPDQKPLDAEVYEDSDNLVERLLKIFDVDYELILTIKSEIEATGHFQHEMVEHRQIKPSMAALMKDAYGTLFGEYPTNPVEVVWHVADDTFMEPKKKAKRKVERWANKGRGERSRENLKNRTRGTHGLKPMPRK